MGLSVAQRAGIDRPLGGGLAVALIASAWAIGPAGAASPWKLLEDVRVAMQGAGPMEARFEQTYVPAGFDTGDTERGRLAIWLPDCLRWRYSEPEEKSFLVCQGEIYAWNPHEGGGRRYRVDPEEEPGLDLLLVEIPTLRERYIAESRALRDGVYDIVLSPPPPGDGGLHATIRVDATRHRVVGLEYRDEEGNLTRFALDGYERLGNTDLFHPPDIEWTEE